MLKIKIADFVIEIDNKYDFLADMCKDYISSDDRVDFSVFVTDAEIEAERATSDDKSLPCGYLEAVCVYRKICLEVLERDAILVHSAVVEAHGQAYAFLARSGTGKSTHISLWKRAYGDEVQIINGDKPICRYIDGAWYAYGTPWCGKEGWHRNTRAKLKAICYIERGEVNSIEKLTPADSASRFMKQILIPRDMNKMSKTFEIVDRILKETSSWLLRCNISLEAATIAYEAMSK